MGVTRMNEECLKLKDHTAGYQTVQDIQRVVTEAIGGRAALRNEQLIDEVMVRLPPGVWPYTCTCTDPPIHPVQASRSLCCRHLSPCVMCCC